MTSKKLRTKFLDFFKNKGHAIIPSASLIPENDPTVLFTTAGMHPLVPYLMGEKHAQGRRLASVQKCVRTVDIDEVGDAVHHTFFEMLGNWSLGDPSSPDGIGKDGYFKKEAIEWSFEFLTKELNILAECLAVSVFAGDENAPLDQDSIDIWKNLGIPENRIVKLTNNWWSPAGQTGPCGPCTEIFYWNDFKNSPPDKFDPNNKSWVEIWNDVFMEYNKTAKGGYEPLKQKNVDTGMGLERILAVLNGSGDDYKTDLFSNLVSAVEQLGGKHYQQAEETDRAIRIIADHIKAAVFIMGDDRGITPSNLGQGYVVRRLIRRAIRYGRQLGITERLWTRRVAQAVIKDYQEAYPELERNREFLISQLCEEEVKFSKTIETGMRQLDKLKNKISGADAFNLYQTYGFPIEMTEEIAKEKGIEINKPEFQKELQKHRELSRTASAGKFKSGLADAGEQTRKLHTATHLLLSALRKVLGSHVFQKGSNITAERLRFDFSHPDKLTEKQLKEIEDLVNKAIKEDLPVVCEEMPLEQAKKQKAMGVFESKYSQKVKVYSIEGYSKEICAGPHAGRTGELGHFKIIKEESSGAGVRRIKATLE